MSEVHTSPVSAVRAVVEGTEFENLKIKREVVDGSWLAGFLCAAQAVTCGAYMTIGRLDDGASHIRAILEADRGGSNSPPEA